MSSQESQDALSALLLVIAIASGDCPTDALQEYVLCDYVHADLLALGVCYAMGWRPDAFLRGCYGCLSPKHKELIDGDLISVPRFVWEMMIGKTVTK